MSQEIIKRHGALAAATIAQLMAESETGFALLLHDKLYERLAGAEVHVGILARRAALLAIQAGNPKVITTNYDDIFETALQGQLKGSTQGVRSVAVPGAIEHTEGFVVYHLHGFLPRAAAIAEDTVGKIVLGDLDFALADEWVSGQRYGRVTTRSE